MKNLLSYSTVLVRRWAWVVLLGVVLCGSAGYGISKISHPVYRATATLILSIGTSTSSSENFTASVAATPTYTQLLTSPAVLSPVIEQHPGLTIEGLRSMMTVKPQSNTPLIELDVDNKNPQLAEELANEISQSLAQFANSQLSGTVQILPAQLPTEPIGPRALTNTGIGALVGLALAVALIVIFEWLDDRLVGPEEVQELLDMEILTIIPSLSRKARTRHAEEIPTLAEGFSILSARLNVAQAEKPFKLLMVTSTLAGEGKSMIAMNLASCLAKKGMQVLLVDADLRNPAVDQYFQLDQLPGFASLSVAMQKENTGDQYWQETDIPSLHILTAGTLRSNSADLLQPVWARQFFEYLKKAPFDYVIFDTPPLLPAAVTQLLASYVREIVLVVDPSKTPRKLLLRTKHLLNKTHNRTLGVILNKSPWSEHGEIREYWLKHARKHRMASSVMVKPPETPSVDGLEDSFDQDTLLLPRFQPAKEDHT